MSPRLRFAARDPGAANVLAGFLKEWRNPGYAWDSWALRHAQARLAECDPPLRLFADGVTEAELEDAWLACPADALVTGTSHYLSFDPLLWRIARRQGCPSLALVDYGGNLRERFTDGQPDYVGAMDARQAADLQALGFAPERILIVGQPWLGYLSRTQPQAAPGEAGDPDAFKILFISEPIATDVASGAQIPWGYDERDSFRLVHRAALESGRPVTIVVKFHPYEQPGPFLEFAATLPPGVEIVPLAPSQSPLPWIAWADLVTGMCSSPLIEALLCGKCVVSIQPGLARDNQFLPARLGMVDSLNTAETALPQLRALITDPAARDAFRARYRPFMETVAVDGVAAIAGWLERAAGPLSSCRKDIP